jgi:hypothetical protein
MQPNPEYDNALLKAHRLHIGVYRRVAETLQVDPSFVSRVAGGKRSQPEVLGALLNELRKIDRQLRRTGK